MLRVPDDKEKRVSVSPCITFSMQDVTMSSTHHARPFLTFPSRTHPRTGCGRWTGGLPQAEMDPAKRLEALEILLAVVPKNAKTCRHARSYNRGCLFDQESLDQSGRIRGLPGAVAASRSGKNLVQLDIPSWLSINPRLQSKTLWIDPLFKLLLMLVKSGRQRDDMSSKVCVPGPRMGLPVEPWRPSQ